MQSQPTICRVCLMEHDEEIHAATLSIRDWFREGVMLGLYYSGLLTEDVECEEQTVEMSCVA
jgi:hypothetical protein